MRKLFILIAIIFVSHSCFCQTLTKSQTHRIGDYGKLWWVLKSFHPEMAYGKINPDSLFTDNIGELLHNPSSSNFKKAVHQMLDRLHDPYTTIEDTGSNRHDSIQLPKRPLLKWLDDSIALLHFDIGFMRGNSNEYNHIGLSRLMDSLKNARGIIVDLRQTIDYYTPGFMHQFISYIIDTDVSYPSFRSRIHYGHESETFDMSRFYYQGWLLRNGIRVAMKKNAIHKPVCILINKFNSNSNDAVAAMQQHRIAKVIADDSLGNFEPTPTYRMPLADGLNINIRLSEVVFLDGNRTFSPDVTIYRNHLNTEDSLIHTAVRLLSSKKEVVPASALPIQNTFATAKVEGYDSLAYPSAPLRLLGLMRFWNAIQYFSPYKDRIIKNWDSVLYEYVPKLLQAKDSLDYRFTVARLITEIHDGHGYFGSLRFSLLGAKAPQVQVKYVENKYIVYKVLNDSSKKGMSPGDEIIAVNDITVKKLSDSIAQYIGASNNAALRRNVANYLLVGKENTLATIKLLHNGKPMVVNLPRNKNWWEVAYTQPEKDPVWKKLNNKTGYVDFGRLEVPQIDSMFNDLKNTHAIIVDNRSYPKGTIWTFVRYLTDKTVVSAKGTTMIADSPDPFTITRQDEFWRIPVTPNAIQYKGKIIFLVNENTQSQAEYNCMVLQAAYKNVTIIGSQTAGAKGDITGISFPGGIQTAFSGHGVHYPDGRPTQGIGIVPDIKITPTIKGIKEGRDEVLERAIQFAEEEK